MDVMTEQYVFLESLLLSLHSDETADSPTKNLQYSLPQFSGLREGCHDRAASGPGVTIALAGLESFLTSSWHSIALTFRRRGNSYGYRIMPTGTG